MWVCVWGCVYVGVWVFHRRLLNFSRSGGGGIRGASSAGFFVVRKTSVNFMATDPEKWIVKESFYLGESHAHPKRIWQNLCRKCRKWWHQRSSTRYVIRLSSVARQPFISPRRTTSYALLIASNKQQGRCLATRRYSIFYGLPRTGMGYGVIEHLKVAISNRPKRQLHTYMANKIWRTFCP